MPCSLSRICRSLKAANRRSLCESSVALVLWSSSESSSSVMRAVLSFQGRTSYSPVSQIRSEPVACDADSMRLFCRRQLFQGSICEFKVNDVRQRNDHGKGMGYPDLPTDYAPSSQWPCGSAWTSWDCQADHTAQQTRPCSTRRIASAGHSARPRRDGHAGARRNGSLARARCACITRGRHLCPVSGLDWAEQWIAGVLRSSPDGL